MRGLNKEVNREWVVEVMTEKARGGEGREGGLNGINGDDAQPRIPGSKQSCQARLHLDLAS